MLRVLVAAANSPQALQQRQSLVQLVCGPEKHCNIAVGIGAVWISPPAIQSCRKLLSGLFCLAADTLEEYTLERAIVVFASCSGDALGTWQPAVGASEVSALAPAQQHDDISSTPGYSRYRHCSILYKSSSVAVCICYSSTQGGAGQPS